MNNMKRYDIFILISTFARNIVLVFSSVFLYKMGYSLKEILLFYAALYFVGMIVSTFTIYFINVMRIKYILIVSSIMFSISFYYMRVMDNSVFSLMIFAIIYGISTYSYYCLRHYLAIVFLDKDKKSIGNIVIYNGISVIISSLLGGFALGVSSLILSMIVILVSLLSIIPIFKFDSSSKKKDKICYEKIRKDRVCFFILEQGRVIFLSLEPLFIYLFVKSSIRYVGISSSLFGLASCLFTYFFAVKIDDKKYFKYINFFFCLLLLIKINVTNYYLMLVIVFFEGFLLKIHEVVSMNNLYDIEKEVNVKGYIILSEIICCFVRTFLCFLFFWIDDLKIILYILILFIFLLGMVKRK